MATPAALELVAVSKRYDTTLAVDTVNLKIPAGSYLLPARPLRLRQDHDAAHDRRPRGVDRGDILLGDRRTSPTCTRPSAARR